MKTKVILDIDNPTRKQIKRALVHHKQHGGLALPPELVQTLTEYCRCGCARPFANVKTGMWFGDRFCQDAIERWSQGVK